MTGLPLYDPDQPLIFIHVPKTGGISTREVFRDWFGRDMRLHYFNARRGGLPPRLDLDRLARSGPAPLIYGHFNRARGFGVDQYYPGVRQFLTILRDPLEMHVSRYFFARRKAQAGQVIDGAPHALSLEEFVETGPLNMLEHFPRPVTEGNYRAMLAGDFLHVGFLDHLGDSLRHMGRLLGKPAPAGLLPHLNQSPRALAIDPEQAARFRARHALEYAVYDHARALFLPRQSPVSEAAS